VQYADLPKGGTIAVFGLGPIGQMCTRIARLQGAEQVIGVDLVPERLALAEQHGVTVLDVTAASNVPEAIHEMTGGRGVDCAIDAVGLEAHGSPIAAAAQQMTGLLPDPLARKLNERFGVDRLDALYSAIDSIRRGGTLSISGVYGGAADPMPMMDLFDRQIQIRMGQANVKRWIDDLMPLVLDDADPLGTEELATHHMPLQEGPRAYELFQKKQDNAIKIVLHP
jgi:threonine dehydrogenase-like Zn-dependent dehydrogenase